MKIFSERRIKNMSLCQNGIAVGDGKYSSDRRVEKAA
jgi:hypothetical protein